MKCYLASGGGIAQEISHVKQAINIRCVALTWCCARWPVYCSSVAEIAIGKNCLLVSSVALLLMNGDY